MRMSEQDPTLLAALLAIREDLNTTICLGNTPKYIKLPCGLCVAVKNWVEITTGSILRASGISDSMLGQLRELWVRWPKYTGDVSYPVPHPYRSPRGAYGNLSNLWDDEYGANRMDLLAWVIQELSYENV